MQYFQEKGKSSGTFTYSIEIRNSGNTTWSDFIFASRFITCSLPISRWRRFPQRSQVPKFGNWENEDNIPYTVYFENARKGKSGNKMNPNNSEMPSDDKSPVQVTSTEQEAETEPVKGPETERSGHVGNTREDGELKPVEITKIQSSDQNHDITSVNSKSDSEAKKDLDATRPSHQRRLSREDGDSRKPYDSPLRPDTIGKKANTDSLNYRLGVGSTDSPKRVVSRQNLGSDHSVEQSPLHPHHQVRTVNKGSGVSSPSWERKGSSEGIHSAPFTPGRSRLKSSVTAGDESPDHGPAVPKFGDWDESDPSAAEGYTHIFNKVREEKQLGTGKVPITPTENSYSNGQKQYANNTSKGCSCCFGWGRK